MFKEHPTPTQVLRILGTHRRRDGWARKRDAEEDMRRESIIRYEESLQLADGIVVPCRFVKKGLLDLGVPEHRVAVVPLGGDRQGLLVPTTQGGVAANGRADRALRLLWVGQPLFRKGFDDMLAAYRALPVGTATLTIVLPSEQSARDAGDIPADASVVVRASPERLAHIFKTHDLLVMPSLVEGFGMVYLEAMNFGLPIVCGRNTGAADLITNGQEGLIVEAGDHNGISSFIVGLADDRDRLEEMKLAAARCGQHWTWGRFRKGLVAALDQLTE